MKLLYLRNEIRKFEERLSECESYCELKKVTNVFKEKWEKEIMSMDKLLKDHKISYRLGNMKSLITMTGSAIGLMNSIENVLGNIPTWMMGTSIMSSGAIGIGTNFINHRARLNEKRNSGSFAYLYEGVNNGILRRGNFREMI